MIASQHLTLVKSDKDSACILAVSHLNYLVGFHPTLAAISSTLIAYLLFSHLSLTLLSLLYSPSSSNKPIALNYIIYHNKRMHLK